MSMFSFFRPDSYQKSMMFNKYYPDFRKHYGKLPSLSAKSQLEGLKLGTSHFPRGTSQRVQSNRQKIYTLLSRYNVGSFDAAKKFLKKSFQVRDAKFARFNKRGIVWKRAEVGVIVDPAIASFNHSTSGNSGKLSVEGRDIVGKMFNHNHPLDKKNKKEAKFERVASMPSASDLKNNIVNAAHLSTTSNDEYITFVQHDNNQIYKQSNETIRQMSESERKLQHGFYFHDVVDYMVDVVVGENGAHKRKLSGLQDKFKEKVPRLAELIDERAALQKIPIRKQNPKTAFKKADKNLAEIIKLTGGTYENCQWRDVFPVLRSHGKKRRKNK